MKCRPPGSRSFGVWCRCKAGKVPFGKEDAFQKTVVECVRHTQFTNLGLLPWASP